MFIACTKPFLVLTHPGYVRVSLEDYKADTELETKEQRARHLTNASVQKWHPNYKKEKESTIWSMQQFKDYLVSTGKIKEHEFKPRITQKMDEMSRLLFLQAKERLD